VKTLLGVYYRLGHLIRELMKFGVVGVVAFITDITLFNLFLHLSDKPLTSKTLSTVVATTVAYIGNRFWTFRHRGRSGVRREYALFFLLNFVGLAIALGCLAISHYLLGFTSRLADNIAANVIGLVLGTTFRFWSYRRFVFPAQRAATAAYEPAPVEPATVSAEEATALEELRTGLTGMSGIGELDGQVSRVSEVSEDPSRRS
jgi:putative flippase GtrA